MDAKLRGEERLREAEMYEEMKDLTKLKMILERKLHVFKQRNFKLRSLVLDNLRLMISNQIKALDEEYQLIGLDKECWKDEEHFLHDLQHKIKASNQNMHTKEQKERMISKEIIIERREERQEEKLLTLVKQYLHLLYTELIEINTEDLLDIKKRLKLEEDKIREIGKLIELEEKEEEKVIYGKI